MSNPSTSDNLIGGLTYAQVPGFPPGTSVSAIRVTLSGQVASPVTVDVAPDSPSVTFANVAPDTYIAVAQGVDQGGNLVGSAVTSAPFTVAAPATLNLPSAIQLSLA